MIKINNETAVISDFVALSTETIEKPAVRERKDWSPWNEHRDQIPAGQNTEMLFGLMLLS